MQINPLVLLARIDEVCPNIRKDPCGEHADLEKLRKQAASTLAVPSNLVHACVPYTEVSRTLYGTL